MSSPKLEPVVLSDDERHVLVGWSSRRQTRALALRSQIVLLCAEGATIGDVAKELGMSRTTVSKWRSRFLANRLEGLSDRPRQGRSSAITGYKVDAVRTETARGKRTARRHRGWWRQPKIIAAIASILGWVAGFVPTVLTAVLSGHEVALNEQGHLAEIHAHATTQMESPSLYGRTAGVETMKRIAWEIPAERRAVVDQLARFVQIQVPPVDSDACLSAWGAPPDVAAALAAISLLNKGSEPKPVDLSSTCLRGAQIFELNFNNVDFSGSDLSRAFFVSNNLRGASFGFADISEAQFVNNDLTSASFCYSSLNGTEFGKGVYAGVNMGSTVDPLIMESPDLTGATYCLDSGM